MQDAETNGTFKMKTSTFETHWSRIKCHIDKGRIYLSRQLATRHRRPQEMRKIKYTAQNLLDLPVYQNIDV